jgi:hypothetical protein
MTTAVGQGDAGLIDPLLVTLRGHCYTGSMPNYPSRHPAVAVRKRLRRRLAMGSLVMALAALAWVLRGTANPTPASPSGRVVVYGTVDGRTFLEWTDARGLVLARRWLPGRVGLVGQWQTVAARGRTVYVAAGGGVWVVRDMGRTLQWRPSPDGAAVQVFTDAGEIYAVTASPRSARVWRLGLHGWAPIWRLPPGLALFLPTPRHPWLLLVRPHSAVVWWGRRLVRWQGVSGLSAAVGAGVVFMPVTEGDGAGVAIWTGRARPRLFLASPRLSVTAVTPAPPWWAVTAAGLVPLTRRGPDTRRVVSWPAPMRGTVTVVQGTPDDLILSGLAQGYWFNPRDGRFQGPWVPVLPKSATILGSTVSPAQIVSAPF